METEVVYLKSGEMEVKKEIDEDLAHEQHLQEVLYIKTEIDIKEEHTSVYELGKTSFNNMEQISAKCLECGNCKKNCCGTNEGTLLISLETEDASKKTYSLRKDQTNSKGTPSSNEFPQADDKSHKCPSCSMSYKFAASLKRHFRNHSGEKPYKCDLCQERFIDTIQLTRHSRIHTDHYHCEYCSEKLPTITKYKIHLSKHTGQKPFECSFCKKRFKNSATLSRHEKTHTGDAPFNCDVCCKPFFSRRDLSRHLMTHNQKECEVCQKKFSDPLSFVDHMKLHTYLSMYPLDNLKKIYTYTCTICGKGFDDSSDFNIHVLIHNIKTPLVCEICGENFVDSAQFIRHSSTHEDPLQCKVCGEKFSTSEKYRTHFKTHAAKLKKIYQCKFCKKKIKDLSSFKAHLWMHVGKGSNQR